ncbi:hypothetical protein LOK49_LG13G01116 [Camellia lanceoleosa]|uniref:Uncharacterized protein n=1 Tax=Camellia lanceoleosa TaxID=1840588 RepID=A0ACC0FHR4_9ERIC|nr:hypothetical protein LOK49_LG13G01116 [Camellia lanceoleosa]
MNNKIGGVAAAAISESFRPLPKRGQIKSRMAAYAFCSIVSVLSRASSHGQHSSGKSYLGETKHIRDHYVELGVSRRSWAAREKSVERVKWVMREVKRNGSRMKPDFRKRAQSVLVRSGCEEMLKI